jgi:hypothetical protein
VVIRSLAMPALLAAALICGVRTLQRCPVQLPHIGEEQMNRLHSLLVGIVTLSLAAVLT